MRRVSKKTAARTAECRDFRKQLIQAVGRCEVCGHDPARWLINGRILWHLECHEIARGPLRQKALDKPYAVLVVCFRCHDDKVSDKSEWPESRQLAALKKSRPGDFDLASYNQLVGRSPTRISEEDVSQWL